MSNHVHRSRHRFADLDSNLQPGTRLRLAALVPSVQWSAQIATLAQACSRLAFVQYPIGKSDPGAQTYRFCSCCEKRRSDIACVRDNLPCIVVCGDIPERTTKATIQSCKARVRRATTSTRYTISSIPRPHAVVVVVVVAVAAVVVIVVVVVVVVVVVAATTTTTADTATTTTTTATSTLLLLLLLLRLLVLPIL